MEKRDSSIDIAKGIGIILVVWGHTRGACPVHDEIYLFHMPLFFILSGCFIHNNETIKLFIYKKVNNLMVPYIVFYFGSLIIKLLLYSTRGESMLSLLKSQNFYSISTVNYPLWFLECLFVVSVIYFFTCRVFKSLLSLYIAIIGFSSFGFYLIKNNIPLPLKITEALTVLPFIHFGNIYFKEKYKFKKSKSIFLILTSVLFFLTGIYFHVKTDIGGLIVDDNPFLFYLPGFGGSFLIIKISEWLIKYNWLKYISKLGTYSLFIFAIHANLGFTNSFINYTVKFIFDVFRYTNCAIINQTALWGIIKVLVSLPICLIIGKFLKTRWPYLWTYKKSGKYIEMLNSKTNA